MSELARWTGGRL